MAMVGAQSESKLAANVRIASIHEITAWLPDVGFDVKGAKTGLSAYGQLLTLDG